jgi:hypothetical protein
MLVNEVIITASFTLNGSYALVAGVGGGAIRYGSETTVPNVFNEKVFLLVPVGIRKSLPLSARSATTLEVDLTSTFLIRDKFELRNVPDPGTFFRKAQGRTLALTGAATYRYSISRTSAISFGVGSSEDLLLHFPDPEQRVRLRKWLFNFTFLRFLQKKTVLKTFKPL